MRICVLEHPRIRSIEHFNDIANTPLWSCLMGGYAAASLDKAGHDVTFWDTTFSQWDFTKTTQELLRLSPDLLCVNVVYLWEHTHLLFEFFSTLKNRGLSGHITLFGFFPTLAWPAILDVKPKVDSIVIGEFEDTLVELAEHLCSGDDLHRIAGLAVREDGKYRLNIIKKGPVSDPDKFPPPFRCSPPGATINILASRGCYNHCQFCPIPSFYSNGPAWNGRDPKLVFAEISALVEQGHTHFYFADPNFIGPGKNGRERTSQLLRLLAPLRISFGMETRPNDLTAKILDALVEAGLNSLLLGVESGSKSILGQLDKYSSSAVSERAIKLCREAGVEPEIGFLMFVPDSTVSDLGDNFEFLKNNLLLDRLDRTANLLSHSQIVLRGTTGYERFRNQGRLQANGLFGFEGKVAFKDNRVAWFSELTLSMCHYVLREMEKSDSPVFWQNPNDTLIHQKLNDYLVATFERLLHIAIATPSLPPAEAMARELAIDLRGLITNS